MEFKRLSFLVITITGIFCSANGFADTPVMTDTTHFVGQFARAAAVLSDSPASPAAGPLNAAGGQTSHAADTSLSGPARTAMMMANAIPAIWRGEMTPLRARLGELRNDESVSLGVWSKVTASRHENDNGEVDYNHGIAGVVAGADRGKEFGNGYLWTGVLAAYSRSSLDTGGNDGKINSYSLGVYSVWQHKSGVYVDAVVKANHFRSSSDARGGNGKVSADNEINGFGFSLETGKYFEGNHYFAEPYAQLSAFRSQKADYGYNNGMRVSADAVNSLSGELGITLGRNFKLDNGTQIKPYLRFAVNHEFSKGSDVNLNNKTTRRNDMSGTTGKYGIGIDARINDRWAIYGELNYADGSKQETPYSGLLGVNYHF